MFLLIGWFVIGQVTVRARGRAKTTEFKLSSAIAWKINLRGPESQMRD
jgi:hypothetical protein